METGHTRGAIGGWLAIALLSLGGCSEPETSSPTYHAGAQEILQRKCATCHYEGANAPFSLTTYDEVTQVQAAVESAIRNGTMPPWQPDDTCNVYVGNTSLTDGEHSTLVDWFSDGAPEGEAAPTGGAVDPETTGFETHLTLGMTEPYLPNGTGPDDYHCFILPWEAEEPSYITGYQVIPGRLDLVHHVLLFRIAPDGVAGFEAMDAETEDPGYTCFGGPSSDDEPSLAYGATLIGGWAPGARQNTLPEGTGLLVEPGSVLVLQVHYNTVVNEPAPDQTEVRFRLADTVERPAISQLLTSPLWLLHDGMPIAAGDSSAVLSTEIDLSAYMEQIGKDIGLGSDDPFVIHRVGLHMHELGRRGHLSILREDQTEECLLRIMDWDFGWQGQYQLESSALFQPNDKLVLECEWDNSLQNQPVVDGAPLEPIDVQWGSGTRDEMCLGVVYITAP